MRLPFIASAAIFALILSDLAHGQAAAPSDEELGATMQQIEADRVNALGWRELICSPKTRLDCGGGACNLATPTVKITLKRETLIRGTISRCDTTCETYDASFNSGGIFTTAQPLVARGYFVKVRGVDEFTEVATAGLGVLLSSGRCERVQ